MTVRTSFFNGSRSTQPMEQPTLFFMTGVEIRRIELKPLRWHAPQMADAASKITPGLRRRSKRAGFSLATTPELPHPAGESMGFGQRSRPPSQKQQATR